MIFKELYDMVHYPAGSSHQRMGTWWTLRDGHGQKQCSGRPCHLNDAQLALRGLKCAKKRSPTPLHHHHQPVVTRHE